MDIWGAFGYRASPYDPEPIRPDAEGARLFVGRDKQLKQLLGRIYSQQKHPTVEGDNGVGKTSLVRVAGYTALQDVEKGRTSKLFLPVTKAFQLNAAATVAEVREDVLYAVAQTLIRHKQLLESNGRDVRGVKALDDYLNKSGGKAGTINLMIPGVGGFGIGGSTGSPGPGYALSGFAKAVEAILGQVFPEPKEHGGVLCLIDNLELLRTSQAARRLLEELRDPVIRHPALKWVLCGARGIVRGAASSDALQGVLGAPIELKPVSDEEVPLLIERRLETFALRADAYPPVTPEEFVFLYDVLNANLRTALGFCEDYASHLADEDLIYERPEERTAALKEWLLSQAELSYEAATSIKGRAWKLFDDLVAEGGSCAPSDYQKLDFNSSEAMRNQMANLEQADLVKSDVGDEDKRRKTTAVTTSGWLVNFWRAEHP